MVDNMQTLLKVLIVFSGTFILRARAQVPELNERFLDVYKNGKWLIEFYAPWCGHCKKLEPIYHQVHQQLKGTDVHVAKIDATRFSTVASQFEVRGFPTIKFISGEKVHTFRGERSKDEIIEFVNKAKGPAVRHLSSIGKLNEVRSQHSDGVFFLFIGDEDPVNDLYSKYATVAEEQVAICYFYAGSKNILPEGISTKSYPTLLVFKDKDVYEYEAPKGTATMSSVQKWISGERYPAYPLVNGPNINEMADTAKFLVIFVIDAHNKKKSQNLNKQVKDLGNYMAVNEREKYHRDFQFMWMDEADTVNSIMMTFVHPPFVLVLDPTVHLYYVAEDNVANMDAADFQFLWMDEADTVNSIMMTFVHPPFVLVLDPTVHLYYVAEDNIANMDATSFGKFLEDVKLGKVQAMGGTGFFQRLKRVFYDILVTVIEVWESSRWLFLIMFGLPTAVISIVCYSICCMESVDDEMRDSDEESEDEEYAHLIQEQARLQKQLEAEEQQAELTDAPRDPKHEKAE